MKCVCVSARRNGGGGMKQGAMGELSVMPVVRKPVQQLWVGWYRASSESGHPPWEGVVGAPTEAEALNRLLDWLALQCLSADALVREARRGSPDGDKV